MYNLANTRSQYFEMSGSNDWFWLADSLADIVWTADLKLRLTYLNRAATRLLGYDIGELMHRPILEVCAPDSIEPLTIKLNEELNKEKDLRNESARVWTVDIKNLCKDGSTLWMETRIGFLRNSGGEPVGFIGVSRDITERRRREYAVQQGKVLSIIGEMTSAIAAEINNPVGGILLSSEQLMMGNISRQTKKDLTMIHGEAKRVARMMSSLLNSCNLAPRQMERFKLHRLLNKVLEIRKYGHETHNIAVATDFQKIAIFVMCDTYQLQQVFTLLIQDAETALHQQNGGNIVVTSRRHGDWARVSIADSRQIRFDHHHDRVLGPVFTRPVPGADTIRMDMMLCHTIISAHGGQLYSEHNRMGGNSFIVELPVSNARESV